jgi:hypothetical protein
MVKKRLPPLLLSSASLVCLLAAHACKAEVRQPLEPRLIQSWIDAQEAERYAVRARAKASLLGGGRPAFNAVTRALQSDTWSREARASLRQVAGTLEASLVWEQLTNRPRRNVRLSARNVVDALTELSHEFRLRLHCDVPGDGLRTIKVNLRLQKVDWAETLAALLNRAGDLSDGVHDEFSCEFVEEAGERGGSMPCLRIVSRGAGHHRAIPSVSRYCARNGLMFAARITRGVPALAEREVWCLEVKGVAPSPFGHQHALLSGLRLVGDAGNVLPVLDPGYVRDVPQGVRADTLLPLSPKAVKRLRGRTFKLRAVLRFKWPNAILRRGFGAPLPEQPIAVSENRSISFKQDASGQLLWTEDCVFQGQGNEPLPGLLLALDENGKELRCASRGDGSAASSWPAREVRTVRYRHYWKTKERPARVVYTFSPGFVVKPLHLVFEGLRIPDPSGGVRPLDSERVLAAF